MTRNLRQAYGEALVELGKANENVVVLEADLGKSTMTNLFAAEYPKRYFQMGIAEQNMASVAAGLALTEKTAFINSFAVFASGRPYDQIRSSICIPRLNVKICGSSAGLSDFGDGKTHQSVDDIAIMRVLPNMTVLSPVDAVETSQMVKAMAEHNGPCYIRINRNDLPIITNPEQKYEIGKMNLVHEGSDAVVFATGIMVSHALMAADALAKEGISLRVVNVSTIKPLDTQVVRDYCQGMRGVVTAEEHSIYGGLGSAILEALALVRIPVMTLGINDTFGTSAMKYEELLEKYHLMPSHVAAKVKAVLACE